MDYEILLLNVSRDLGGLSESFRDSIGQYSIAAYLRKHDFKAYVYSGNIICCRNIIKHELECKKTNIIGFYAAADNIRVVSNVIKWIKEIYPECMTVIGGPQVAGLDYDFFERTGTDYAVIGEGEIPIYLLLSYLVDGMGNLESIPSLVRKDDVEKKLIINSSDGGIVNNLDEIDFPKVEDSYNGRLRQGEVVGIITGRGCPNHCAFCYEGANAKNVRFRSVSNVMNEIDYIREHNDRLSFISIYDDTFTLNKARILEFCNEIEKRNVTWFCEGHISFVINQTETLKRMIQAGLSCIQFGIESGSNLVLNAYNKHTDFDMIVKAVKICKSSGIHSITGNFIIGGAFETKETLEKSKELAKILINEAKGIIELYTVYFAPYPNTRMVRKPEYFDIKIYPELQEKNLNTMRMPVVSTRELSINNIYDAKHEFDSFLKQEYKKATLRSVKSDVFQGLVQDGKRIHLNPTWESMYYSLPHISNFMQHISDEEQNFNKNFYIIRTFEDFKIDHGRMVTDAGDFEGLEQEILQDATGGISASDMANRYQVSIEEIEKTYTALNNRCLVYMTQF